MVDNPESNKKIVETFVNDVFINHDLGRLDGYMRDDYIQHKPDVAQGKKGFIEFFKMLFKAIPDYQHTILKMVAEGDIVMVYHTTTGTHTGDELLGQTATGNKLNYDVVDIFRIQDGMIAEHWDVIDTFTLYKQFGIIERLMAEDR